MRDSRTTEDRGGAPLSPRHSGRPPAPDHVWDFQSLPRWRDAAWGLVSHILDERVKGAFRRDPPRYVVGDDLGWLDAIVERVTGRVVDSKSLMAAMLAERFSALRAYHATSTHDVDGFYQDGLLPLAPDAVHARAREIFLGGGCPELRPEDLERAIASVGHGLREGRVFFEANETLLVEHCGHYLLYGGEYLTAIAASLPRHRDYRQALKGVGKPTVFVCDVPLADIGGSTLLEFAGMALEFLFQELLDGEEYAVDSYRGGGFSIRKPLAPGCLVGHYHPVGVRDPLTG